MQARAIAALVVRDVLGHKQTLTQAIPDYLNRTLDPKDHSFIKEICFGVTRRYFQLDCVLDQLLNKSLKRKDNDIRALILVGLYQLIFMRTPPHAAVSATVDACDDLRKPWAKQLINAILRGYQRDSERLLSNIQSDANVCFNLPEWLLKNLQKDYPNVWQSIAESSLQHPPMTLRVNKAINRQNYLAKLNAVGIKAEITSFSPSGIRLKQAVKVDQLPGFFDGLVSVQDEAAQLAFPLMDIGAGHHVLDTCAAPGGKLAHILEEAPDNLSVIAIEEDSARFHLLHETLKRLRLTATLVMADARNTQDWWDGDYFDRVMIDAPCSASGIIRRHPDIKLMRTQESLLNSIKIQSELLCAVWPLLNSGGKLLYITCSILKDENDNQIKSFMCDHLDAKKVIINSDWGTPTEFGRQILPGDNDMDGFYYACLQKIQ